MMENCVSVITEIIGIQDFLVVMITMMSIIKKFSGEVRVRYMMSQLSKMSNEEQQRSLQ